MAFDRSFDTRNANSSRPSFDRRATALVPQSGWLAAEVVDALRRQDSSRAAAAHYELLDQTADRIAAEVDGLISYLATIDAELVGSWLASAESPLPDQKPGPSLRLALRGRLGPDPFDLEDSTAAETAFRHLDDTLATWLRAVQSLTDQLCAPVADDSSE